MNNSTVIASSAKPAWPLIKVNGVELDQDVLGMEMQYHPAESQDEAMFLAAQALVIRMLLRQRAEQLELQALPAADESEEEALIRVLLEREVQVPDSDPQSLEQVYQSNLSRFCSAPLVQARHILLAVAPDDTVGRSRLRDEAIALIAELKSNPTRFAERARDLSACPSREQGGDLGQLSLGQTVPEFERQLLRLPTGLAGQPLESRYGFHVVEVQQRIEGRQLPFAAVRESIREELDERVWSKAVVQYLETLIGQSRIEGIALRAAASPLLQ
ncbi:peptidylprolyl isomerase [Halopseudomonas salegens]|uniref:peptidylprolyl isomerase n=1 Tax=Halopseudomonas salegens TaxID=1434072 RepID=A0A1H2F899_9GAMM|nr:peptidylprolyl isomerase [Halopseudomonas salegens]SDU03198.1 peptidyl-prolyl cis-trans isomerase C [Halopseudomonas salegens]